MIFYCKPYAKATNEKRQQAFKSYGDTISKPSFLIKEKEKEIFLNEYFHLKPEMMLGRLERAEHGMYGRDEVRLADDGRGGTPEWFLQGLYA